MVLSVNNGTKVVRVLSEALPYIRNFRNKTIVVKYGGNAMLDDKIKQSFARDIVLLKLVGMNPIVVHGGGPQIDGLLSKVGKRPEYVQGMRVTDSETMELVEMVLGGAVNKEIVSLIHQQGGKALGLTGKDGAFIRAKKLRIEGGQRNFNDIGHVGEVESIDPKIISLLEGEEFIPVVAPIGVGKDGSSFNINADLVAGTLASVLKAEKLVLLTNTPGVLDEKGDVINNLSPKLAKKLVSSGGIHSGMLPKVKSALEAVLSGVTSAHIIDGRVEHSLLLEILTDTGVGTLIARKKASDILR